MSSEVTSCDCSHCGTSQTMSVTICDNCGRKSEPILNQFASFRDGEPKWVAMYWNESHATDSYRHADLCPQCLVELLKAFPNIETAARRR